MATPVRLACIQMPCFGIDRAREALDYALRQIDAAAAQHPDLVILPEATYPAYYLRSRLTLDQMMAPSTAEALDLFAAAAARHRCHLVVGVATGDGEQKARNEAVLIGPGGQIIGRYAKTFLWHFDAHWFQPGGQYPVFETSLGRLGLMICADGRLPEIARALTLQGAQLIVNPTAWVSSGRDARLLTNPQYEYMIPARSRENGVWIASANKVGVEEESIVYCGRSCVVDPRGRRVAVASADSPEILFAEIDLDATPSLPVARRPLSYGLLCEEPINLPVTACMDEPVVIEATVGVACALQLSPYASAEELLRRADHLLHALSAQDAGIIVFPDVPVGARGTDAYTVAACLAPMTAMTQEHGCSVLIVLSDMLGAERYKTAYLISEGEILLSYRGAHLSEAERGWFTAGGGDYPVVKSSPLGNVGVMVGCDGLVPEVARSLMLGGADVVLWTGGEATPDDPLLARSRADENRVFVVRSALAGPESNAMIASPLGQIVAEGFLGGEQAVSAQINWAWSRCKSMAPHTNVVLNRMPSTYGILCE